VYEKARKSNAGAKPIDVVLMFKILVLQQLNNVSDDRIEYQIRDRLSFMRLCVQLRLVCSVGVSPTRVIGQSPVAWMAGVRETDQLQCCDRCGRSRRHSGFG